MPGEASLPLPWLPPSGHGRASAVRWTKRDPDRPTGVNLFDAPTEFSTDSGDLSIESRIVAMRHTFTTLTGLRAWP